MITIILENLKKIDNPLATTLVSIAMDTLPSVEDSFYESTVFESKDGFRKNSFQLENAFQANFGKQLVETPLTYVRGKGGPVFVATPGKGITTGIVLFDYITKNPLLLVTIDKTSTSYKYESAKYNAETKSYDSLTSKTKAAKSIAELATFVSDNVGKDIATFVTK